MRHQTTVFGTAPGTLPFGLTGSSGPPDHEQTGTRFLTHLGFARLTGQRPMATNLPKNCSKTGKMVPRYYLTQLYFCSTVPCFVTIRRRLPITSKTQRRLCLTFRDP